MRDLLQGRLERVGYCALLRNLHALYAALEDALSMQAEHPVLALVDHPAQHRRHTLAADLAALQGPDWPAQLPLQPAMQDYVERLHALARGDAPLLAAHVYTRSLGDLHGGQILRDRVARMLGLDAAADGAGTQFYDFGSEDQVQQLRARLRDALARLPVTPAQEDAIVAEACWSFRQHQLLFAELGA